MKPTAKHYTSSAQRGVHAAPGPNRSGQLRRNPIGALPVGLNVIAVASCAAAIIAGAALGGCGSGSSATVSLPKVAPARVYALNAFKPSGSIEPGHVTTVSFTIRQPSGKTLTDYRTCCEPHEGVDLIVVRADDSHLQYDDSDIAANGQITQPVVFPAPGRYRVVVNAYLPTSDPAAQNNFQLFRNVNVAGRYRPSPLPPFNATQNVDGYRFQIRGTPHLHAIQPAFLRITVRDPQGRPATFTTWRGALAHAIFIREGTLDYFHTHVCSPGAIYCASALGATRITGSSSAPGQLKVGVLLPVSGTWRMFLLTYMHGHVLTVPYTLHVTG